MMGRVQTSPNVIHWVGDLPSRDYVQIPNDMARGDLTPDAKAVALMLRSHGARWETSQKSIALALGIGRPRVRNAFRELVAKRWLVVRENRNHNGNLVSAAYIMDRARRFTEDEARRYAIPYVVGSTIASKGGRKRNTPNKTRQGGPSPTTPNDKGGLESTTGGGLESTTGGGLESTTGGGLESTTKEDDPKKPSKKTELSLVEGGEREANTHPLRADDDEPPLFCSRHPNGSEGEPCRPCGDARRIHEVWDRNRPKGADAKAAGWQALKNDRAFMRTQSAKVAGWAALGDGPAEYIDAEVFES